jgi:hypothetical protein
LVEAQGIIQQSILLRGRPLRLGVPQEGGCFYEDGRFEFAVRQCCAL